VDAREGQRVISAVSHQTHHVNDIGTPIEANDDRIGHGRQLYCIGFPAADVLRVRVASYTSIALSSCSLSIDAPFLPLPLTATVVLCSLSVSIDYGRNME
jgi:hypothetical protein